MRRRETDRCSTLKPQFAATVAAQSCGKCLFTQAAKAIVTTAIVVRVIPASEPMPGTGGQSEKLNLQRRGRRRYWPVDNPLLCRGSDKDIFSQRKLRDNVPL